MRDLIKSVSVVFVVLAIFIAMGAGYYLETPREGYKLCRAEGDEDAASAALCLATATKGDFANKSATAHEFRCDEAGFGNHVNAGRFIFCAGSAAEKTFGAIAFGYAADNGPAVFLFDVTCTTGAQAVVKYLKTGSAATSKFWVDTITHTGDDDWGWKVCDSGNDRVCTVDGDFKGIKFVKVYIYAADGETGAEAGDVSCYLRPLY